MTAPTKTAHQAMWQRIKRRICLWGGAYVHPDGHLELDFDEKAGIRKDDDEHVAVEKFYAWQRRENERL